jgi:ketosteroid isomerase-like protein
MAALERLNTLFWQRDAAILSEFAADDVALIGSEVSEVVAGREQVEQFLRRVLGQPAHHWWEWTTVHVSSRGSIAWLFADGSIVIPGEGRQSRLPFRITGVLEEVDGKWLWRQFHAAEPVPDRSPG